MGTHRHVLFFFCSILPKANGSSYPPKDSTSQPCPDFSKDKCNVIKDMSKDFLDTSLLLARSSHTGEICIHIILQKDLNKEDVGSYLD